MAIPSHIQDPPITHHEAVDSTARNQITGLRGEFHEFRVEIKNDVETMRGEIGNGFSKVFNRMDHDSRANLQASKSGLGVIASFSLGVIGLAFSFTTIITSPLREQDARQTMLLDKQFDRDHVNARDNVERSLLLGQLKATGETNRDRIVCLEDFKERIAKLEGMLAASQEND